MSLLVYLFVEIIRVNVFPGNIDMKYEGSNKILSSYNENTLYIVDK